MESLNNRIKVLITEWVKDRQCLKTGRESGKFRDTEKDKIFKCVIEHTRPIGHYKKFKSAGNGQRRRQMSKARETF